MPDLQRRTAVFYRTRHRKKIEQHLSKESEGGDGFSQTQTINLRKQITEKLLK
jgi:hypothetical protein